MLLVVGLGNPGERYKKTRHNAGFMFVDKMAGDKKFSLSKKFEAEILEMNGYLLVKPQTFMNDSGRAVGKIMDFYKLKPKDLVLVHDDLDLQLGEKKIQMGTGPKVHNGLNSVEETLGSKEFMRVRIGVDNRKNTPTSLNGADYVLANPNREESEILNKVIDETVAELLIALSL